MSDYLRQEKKAADFFLDNRFSLKKCPEDSISYNGNLLFADAAISVSSDALELLKSSSLFQKIGDKDLSMKIIRAYDTCGAIASSMNRHLEDRNNRFDKAINNETAKQLITGSNINIRKFISSPYGAYSVQWVANQPDPSQYVDKMYVTRNGTTITASFVSDPQPGMMQMYHSSTSVPGGWLVPLNYVNVGRPEKETDEIAKVRLIVPHSQGTADASSSVYPCYYEITYERVK